MKRLFALALVAPAIALAQALPSPSFDSLTLTNPLTPANGGTGTTASTGTGSAVLSNSPTLTTPSISGGTINNAPVGATTASTGAFTTLSSSALATLYGITTPSTGNFYAGQGASITRINDRLFVSGATANNGTQVASQPDWLTQFQLATGRTGGFIQLTNFAVLNGSNPQNQSSMVVAAQSSNNTLSGGAIGAILMGINNNTSITGSVYASYIEAYRMAGVSGGADGLEIDTVNYGGNVVLDPYQQNAAQTVALQLAAGAELPSTGQYPSQAAINIQNNHSTFDSGIVFGNNALTNGLAIAFSSGQRMQWFGNTATPISSIVATGTTQAAGIQQLFSDNAVNFNNSSGNSVFGLLGVGSGVNGVTAIGSATGASPQLVASGSDANIPLTVSGKGTGGVYTAGATDGSSVPAGFVGQIVPSTFSSVSMATSGTAQNLTSISLPPGDWYVEGYVTYSVASGATLTDWIAGVNTVSATVPALGNYWQMHVSVAGGTGVGVQANAPVSRQNVTANTTVYLVGQATFSGGTVAASGYLRATRRP